MWILSSYGKHESGKTRILAYFTHLDLSQWIIFMIDNEKKQRKLKLLALGQKSFFCVPRSWIYHPLRTNHSRFKVNSRRTRKRCEIYSRFNNKGTKSALCVVGHISRPLACNIIVKWIPPNVPPHIRPHHDSQCLSRQKV